MGRRVCMASNCPGLGAWGMYQSTPLTCPMCIPHGTLIPLALRRGTNECTVHAEHTIRTPKQHDWYVPQDTLSCLELRMSAHLSTALSFLVPFFLDGPVEKLLRAGVNCMSNIPMRYRIVTGKT